MPMIDVYAAAGTFPDSHALARDLAAPTAAAADFEALVARQNRGEQLLQADRSAVKRRLFSDESTWERFTRGLRACHH